MSSAEQDTTNPTIDTWLIQLAWKYSLTRTYQAGATIFNEGDPGSSMLLVLAGIVNILKKVDGQSQPKLIANRSAGSFLGEMALVEAAPRFATVIAATDCEVLEFSRDSFEKVIREQPTLAIAVLKSLSCKLRESDSVRIAELEESNRLLTAANEELVHLNVFLDCIIDQSPSAIFLTTRKGDIFRMNKAALKMFDVETPEKNIVIDDLFLGSNFTLARKETSSTWHAQVRGIRGGLVFPAYLSVTSLSDHENSVLFLVICQDITELQKLNETVIQVEKYESERQTAIEVAHDVKNLLGILIGNIELILSGLTDKQNKQVKKYIQAVNNTSGEITQFLNDIMIYHERARDSSEVKLQETIEALVSFCRSQARFQDICFAVKVSTGFPEVISIKEEEIRRAILNLLVNAGEACLQDPPHEKAHVSVDLAVAPDKESIIIKVNDNGPGFEPAHLDKVFSSRFTTKNDGHGIGLVSVAKIIQLLRGEISVDSQPGATTFELRLPISRDLPNA